MNKILILFVILVFCCCKTEIRNYLHVHLVMNLYTLKKYLTNDGGTWMYLNKNDLIRFLDKILTLFPQDLRNKKVLDLGCGDCTMLKHLSSKYNIDPYGVDISGLNMIICKKKINGKFYTSDIIEYLEKCKDNTFDFIICYGVLVYFQDKDKQKILYHIHRVLKKNSYAWIGGNMRDSFTCSYPITSEFIKSIKYKIQQFDERKVFNNKYNSTSIILFQ